MILHANPGYWATCIQLRWSAHTETTADGTQLSGWYAHLDFYDDGFCDDDPDTGKISTQGRLATRYGVADGDTVTGLRAAIDALVADAARMGINFTAHSTSRPYLYYEGDGDSEEFPPPDGWRQMLADEAARLGWRSVHDAGEVSR